MNNNVVVYHNPCFDGMGSMIIARKTLGEDATYIKGRYHEAPDMSLFIDKEVFLLDFSYKREVVVRICEVANHVTILDHHITAKNELAIVATEFNNIRMDYDIAEAENLSGVGIVWKYFHGDAIMPMVLRHIQDRDIWTKAMKDTDIICSYLSSIGEDVERWNDVVFGNVEYSTMIMIGSGIEASRRRMMKSQKNTVVYQDFGEIPNIPHFINCPRTIFSDLAHMVFADGFDLCTNKIWDQPSQKWIWSLRSSYTGPDVSILAKLHGGGGHEHAAGFSTENENI